MSMKRSEVPHRKSISEFDLALVTAAIEVQINKVLKEKGSGAWLSRHELLGVLTEEYYETIDAVHQGTERELMNELADVAVTCIFGIACIKKKTLDW